MESEDVTKRELLAFLSGATASAKASNDDGLADLLRQIAGMVERLVDPAVLHTASAPSSLDPDELERILREDAEVPAGKGDVPDTPAERELRAAADRLPDDAVTAEDAAKGDVETYRRKAREVWTGVDFGSARSQAVRVSVDGHKTAGAAPLLKGHNDLNSGIAGGVFHGLGRANTIDGHRDRVHDLVMRAAGYRPRPEEIAILKMVDAAVADAFATGSGVFVADAFATGSGVFFDLPSLERASKRLKRAAEGKLDVADADDEDAPGEGQSEITLDEARAIIGEIRDAIFAASPFTTPFLKAVRVRKGPR